MLQLTQKLSNGEVSVQEVPEPLLSKGYVLVQNHYSVVSTGTEGKTAKTAQKNLLGKAKERPKDIKQVIDVVQAQGLKQAYRAVSKKLEAYSPTGYSSSGIVISVGEGITSLKKGDPVACAGVGYANHAEIVSVPENLCVKLSKNANLKVAAFNTIGAIAMQGVRQANLNIGENCVIIGLGLIGQITGLILRAAGVNTIGIDIDQRMVDISNNRAVDIALARNTAGLLEQVQNLTTGIGADAILITAATTSLDPINLAGDLAKKKAKVIIVGDVPTGFSRDVYYKKELEVLMSSSYGPGRYDLNYEEKGIDYPIGYVRWTEQRNMQAFQELLYKGRIDIGYLISHEYPLKEAADAYLKIANPSEPILGMVIEYPKETKEKTATIQIHEKRAKGDVRIAFVGAGSYAQSHLLPNLPKNDISISRVTILTNQGTTSKRVAERFKFESCTSEEKSIFSNPEINTVFVATRHDSHAYYVLKSIKNGKNVFVEKPLCLTIDQLDQIHHSVLECNGENHVMVGFNRRFAPLVNLIKENLSASPLSMIYRINAGFIPKSSWIQDMEIGGGRIIGEVCHFVDLMIWLNGSLPVSVSAFALNSQSSKNDTVTANIEFENGSIGTILYFANGSKKMPKEYLEVYQNGATAVLKDYKELEFISEKKRFRKKTSTQDKGQKNMVHAYTRQLKKTTEPLIPFSEIYATTLTTFKIIDSIVERKTQYI